MATIAVCNYVRFKTFAGAYVGGYNFQNFTINASRSRGGVTYLFAPFAVTSGAGTKGGDRSEAAVVAPSYPIAIDLFTEAALNNYFCEITTVLLNPTTFADISQISQETWVCSRPEVNVERAVLQLASPLDAVDAQIPKRTLSSSLVGSIPATGSVTTA